MKFFQSLFTANPFVMACFSGSRRVGRSMAGSKSGTLLAALACIPLVLIVVFTISVGASAGMEVASVCFFVAVIAQYLIIPAIFFNSIAGERERGSWELLRAAPVTTVQILTGKFILGVIILLPWFVTLILSVLTVLAVSLTENSSSSYIRPFSAETLFGGFAVIFSQALILSSLTIFLSARMKKPFSALIASYGISAAAAILLPFVFGILPSNDNYLRDLWLSLQPMNQVSHLAGWERNSQSSITSWPLFCLIYIIFSVIFLTWAALTLDYPDRDLKFIKNKGK